MGPSPGVVYEVPPLSTAAPMPPVSSAVNTQAYVLPPGVTGHRYWVATGDEWRERPVFVPVGRGRLFGPREVVTLGHERGPIFRARER